MCIDNHQNEINRLKARIKMLDDICRSRFKEGLMLGKLDAKRAEIEYKKARNDYLNENESLTNLLMKTEGERDLLKDELSKLKEKIKALA